MQHMPVLLASLCHSSASSSDWMLAASWLGLFVCAAIGIFHSARVLFVKNSQHPIDVLAESCHVFMGAGMAYMFAPIAEIKVIPDSLWAIGFAILTVAFSVRPLLRKSHYLGDSAHALMNLSMVYMLLQSSWDAPLLTAGFILFFAAYATVHVGEFLVDWRSRRMLSNPPALIAEPALSAVSHVLMSAAMIFMFLMPAMMASGMNHHLNPESHSCCDPASGSSTAGDCCSPGKKATVKPVESTQSTDQQQHHHHH